MKYNQCGFVLPTKWTLQKVEYTKRSKFFSRFSIFMFFVANGKKAISFSKQIVQSIEEMAP